MGNGLMENLHEESVDDVFMNSSRNTASRPREILYLL